MDGQTPSSSDANELFFQQMAHALPRDLLGAMSRAVAHDRRWYHLTTLCREWFLPADASVVLYLVLAVRTNLCTLDDLAGDRDLHPLLMQRIQVLFHMLHPYEIGDATTHRARQTAWRRELFRLAYRDAPLALGCLILHICDIHGNFAQLRKSEQRLMREQSSNVFLPVAELFGLWEIRSELARESLKLFKPDAFQAIESLLARTKSRRQERFMQVRKGLSQRLHELEIDGYVQVHQSSIYSIYRRLCSGGSLQRLVSNLKVDVIVNTEDDYHRAGSLLVPANALSSTGRSRSASWLWQEQLKFNGYRAILLTMQKSLQERDDTPDQIYILTHRMQRINTYGYVAVQYWGVPPAHGTRIWWEAGVSGQAVPRSDEQPGQTVTVFGPSGERHTVPAGCTAIGFAYRVHADIGTHCKRIWINGKPAEADDVLAPDDLIEIDFDLHSIGPLDRWFEKMPKALRPSALQRAYTQHVVNPRKGRALLLQAVRHRCEQQQVPLPSDRDLEELIRQVACHDEWNYIDLEPFYTDLANRQLQRIGEAPLVEDIVHLLMTRILARDLRFAATPDTSLPQSLKVKLARSAYRGQSYMVIRDQPIVGRIRKDRILGSILTVYPEAMPGAPSGEQAIALVWSRQQQVRLTIHAVDRPQLLGNLLDALYQLYDTCYLTNLNAQTNAGPQAVIEADLTIQPDQVERIKAVLDQLCASELITQYYLAAYNNSERSIRIRTNPYSLTPAATPAIFKGRTSELAQIVTHVQEHGGLFAVVGHNRIGKTSLLCYLADHVLSTERIGAAFCSTALATPTVRSFWRTIAMSIDEQIQANPDRKSIRQHWESLRQPQGLFLNSIARARRILGVKKFVLVLDEFTKLQESWASRDVAEILDHLTSCLEMDKDLAIVIGVHDEVFQRSDTPVQRFLAQGAMIRLGHLDKEAARRLIIEPPGQLVHYEPEAVHDLLLLTGSHPYYLQYLLSNLLRSSPHTTALTITRREVADTVAHVLADGFVIFYHYLQHLRHTLAFVALAAAEVVSPADGFTEQMLTTYLGQQGIALPGTTLRQSLENLTRCGILRCYTEHMYRYQVPLFQQWLREQYALIELVDTYREGGVCYL